MKTEDLLKLGLDEKTAQKIAVMYAEEQKNFIPKARFDEVNVEKKRLEGELQKKDEQLCGFLDASGETEGLKERIAFLEKSGAQERAGFEEKIRSMRLDAAVDKALADARAKNVKAVRFLMSDFLQRACLDENGIAGLDDEIKRLMEAEDSKFLFEPKKEQRPRFRGLIPGDKRDERSAQGTKSLADALRVHFEGE